MSERPDSISGTLSLMALVNIGVVTRARHKLECLLERVHKALVLRGALRSAAFHAPLCLLQTFDNIIRSRSGPIHFGDHPGGLGRWREDLGGQDAWAGHLLLYLFVFGSGGLVAVPSGNVSEVDTVVFAVE